MEKQNDIMVMSDATQRARDKQESNSFAAYRQQKLGEMHGGKHLHDLMNKLEASKRRARLKVKQPWDFQSKEPDSNKMDEKHSFVRSTAAPPTAAAAASSKSPVMPSPNRPFHKVRRTVEVSKTSESPKKPESKCQVPNAGPPSPPPPPPPDRPDEDDIPDDIDPLMYLQPPTTNVETGCQKMAEICKAVLTNPKVVDEEQVEILHQFHNQFGTMYSDVRLDTTSMSIAEMAWMTVACHRYRKALHDKTRTIPEYKHDNKVLVRLLRPDRYFSKRMQQAQIDMLELMFIKAILCKTGSNNNPTSVRGQGPKLNRKFVSEASDSICWLRYIWNLFKTCPLTEQFEMVTEEEERKVHIFLNLRLQAKDSTNEFSMQGRNLIYEQHIPLGSEARYRREFAKYGTYFGILDVVSNSFTEEEVTQLNVQQEAAVYTIGLPNGQEDKAFWPHVKATWRYQAFRAWFKSNTIDPTDFVTEYSVMWNDWGSAKAEGLMSLDERVYEKRRPLIVNLGVDAWFVHHNGKLHQGRPVATEASAIALWTKFVFANYGGKLENGHDAPNIFDAINNYGKKSSLARRSFLSIAVADAEQKFGLVAEETSLPLVSPPSFPDSTIASASTPSAVGTAAAAPATASAVAPGASSSSSATLTDSKQLMNALAEAQVASYAVVSSELLMQQLPPRGADIVPSTKVTTVNGDADENHDAKVAEAERILKQRVEAELADIKDITDESLGVDSDYDKIWGSLRLLHPKAKRVQLVASAGSASVAPDTADNPEFGQLPSASKIKRRNLLLSTAAAKTTTTAKTSAAASSAASAGNAKLIPALKHKPKPASALKHRAKPRQKGPRPLSFVDHPHSHSNEEEDIVFSGRHLPSASTSTAASSATATTATTTAAAAAAAEPVTFRNSSTNKVRSVGSLGTPLNPRESVVEPVVLLPRPNENDMNDDEPRAEYDDEDDAADEDYEPPAEGDSPDDDA